MNKVIWSFPVQIQIEVEDFLQANELFDKLFQAEDERVLMLFDRQKAVHIYIDELSGQAKYRLPTAHELKLINNLTLDPKIAGIANRVVDRMIEAEQRTSDSSEIQIDIRAKQREAEIDLLTGDLKPDAEKCIADSCPYMTSRMALRNGAKVDGPPPSCHVCGLKVDHDLNQEL